MLQLSVGKIVLSPYQNRPLVVSGDHQSASTKLNLLLQDFFLVELLSFCSKHQEEKFKPENIRKVIWCSGRGLDSRQTKPQQAIIFLTVWLSHSQDFLLANVSDPESQQMRSIIRAGRGCQDLCHSSPRYQSLTPILSVGVASMQDIPAFLRQKQN